MSDTVWMLTTTDNPYNPFTDWESWLIKDIALGHNTCALLARTASVSDEIDDGGEVQAMAEVVRHNWSGVHIMVTADTFDDLMRVQ